MRVMFDISSLGCGQAVPLYRNGTFRYVRQIAVGLAKSNELELTLSAGLDGSNIWHKLYNLEASLAHWEADDALNRVRFPYNRLLRTLGYVIRKSGGGKANMMFDSLESLLSERVLERYLSPLNESTVGDADIFHSPSFAFPEFTASINRLKRFLSVQDMLPVLYPRFFDPGAEFRFKAILGRLRRADWILCSSRNTKDDLCEYFPLLDESKIFVALLAADPELFYRCDDQTVLREARGRYNIPEAPYVLSVCAIEPRKNLDHVVRCFTDLVHQQKIEDLNLVLVGPAGWKNKNVFDQINNSGNLRQRIILTGYVRNEDMAAIYSGAMMFVYPSLYEGFGLPPLEAMQCGVPVITSNISSLPEVVGDAGILVDPRDSDQLCSNMLKLYQSPSLRADLSASSFTRSKQFSWQRCVSQTIEAYRVALGG